MKNREVYIVMILVGFFINAFILQTCEKLDYGNKTKSRIEKVVEIEDNKVQITSDIFDLSSELHNDYGICFSQFNVKPTITDSTISQGVIQQKGKFNVIIENLKPGAIYYFRVYVMDGNVPIYSLNEIKFTTKSVIPSLSTKEIAGINSTSASSGGDITDDGGATISSRGVCWSDSPNPTLLDNKTVDGNGKGSFISNLTELYGDTKYYVRAYATNKSGTAYGNEISFTTCEAVLPTLTTLEIGSITANSAFSGGNVSSDGGASVTKRGICWKTSNNPTVDDFTSEDGSGKGIFTSRMENLIENTTYYVRAYATNSVGTSYGNEVSFTARTINKPTVITVQLSEINQTWCTGGGNVINDGGADVTARGVCWGAFTNPTIDLVTKTIDGSGIGSYTSTIDGLIYGTIYYLRAYATNSAGTAYGDEIIFATSGLIFDVDGNSYNTIKIGNQQWMKENLKTTKYNDNTFIEYPGYNYTTWRINTTGAYAYFDNSESYKQTYGALYNWYAVNTGKLCPIGWHVATDEDWTILENYLISGGYNFDGSTTGNKIAKAMAALTSWVPSTVPGTPGNDDYSLYRNKSGFSVIAAGARDEDGNFFNNGSTAIFWTSTDDGTSGGISRSLSCSSVDLSRSEGNPKARGYSVRCVKD